MRFSKPSLRTVNVGDIIFGLLAIGYAASPLSYGLKRHWNMADSLIAYLGTLQTYAIEIFVETDFIGVGKTLIAWGGLIMMISGLLGLLAFYMNAYDRNERLEEDHGTAQ